MSGARTTRQALEAILFVAEEPLDESTLRQVLELGRAELRSLLEELAGELERDRRGFVLREVAGGWRLYTAPEAAAYVERFALSRRPPRLSQAALETLAVVAYKQPISRHHIGEVRGVNPDAALRTLVARGLVTEVGRDEGPGQAILYGTTARFLEQLGLRELDALPPLARFLAAGPAPDEPDRGEERLARARIRAGDEDPANGERRALRESEMEALSEELERATREAMATLDRTLEAITGDDEPEGGAGT